MLKKVAGVALAAALGLFAFAQAPAQTTSGLIARGFALQAAKRSDALATIGAQSANAMGDSLVAGDQDGSGVTGPAVLAKLSGMTVANEGIGGQTSGQIALRAGAIPMTLSFAGDTIQPFVALTTVTAINGAAPASMASNGAALLPLSTSADNTDRVLGITVHCGGATAHGSLIRHAAGGPPSTAEIYLFRADSVALPLSCPAGSVAVPDFNWGAPTIFDMGRNDFPAVATVEANIDAMAAKFAAAGNTSWWWIDIPDAPGEGSGTSNYATLTSINSYVAAKYPGHAIGARAYLVTRYNPALPADVSAHARDQVPPSLQLGDGSVHLNAAGYTAAWTYAYQVAKAQLDSRQQVGLGLSGIGSLLNSPLALGAPLSVNCGRQAVASGMEVCGNLFLRPGSMLYTTDGYGYFNPLVSSDGFGTVSLGAGYNVQKICIGANGADCSLSLTSNQNDLINTRSYLDRSYGFAQPSAGGTVTIPDTSDLELVAPAATLASLTVTLPTCSTAYDGKVARVAFAKSVTALTIAATAGSISGTPTAAAAGSTSAWLCHGADATWYRMQ